MKHIQQIELIMDIERIIINLAFINIEFINTMKNINIVITNLYPRLNIVDENKQKK